LSRPADGDGIVLDFQRGFLGIVHHPEEHGIDVDRHGVRCQRLFGSEPGRDHALVDRTDDRVDEGNDPEEAGPAHADESAKTEHDGPFPLLGDAGRHGRNHTERNADRHPDEGAGECGQREAAADDHQQDDDGYDVEDHDEAPLVMEVRARRRSAAENPFAEASPARGSRSRELGLARFLVVRVLRGIGDERADAAPGLERAVRSRCE
jgi:hypothetical protein